MIVLIKTFPTRSNGELVVALNLLLNASLAACLAFILFVGSVVASPVVVPRLRLRERIRSRAEVEFLVRLPNSFRNSGSLEPLNLKLRSKNISKEEPRSEFIKLQLL